MLQLSRFNGEMRTHLRSLLGMTTVLTGALLLSGCASTPAPAPTPSLTASAAAAEITSTSLLTQAAADVLDQVLTYPSASQAQVSSSIITIPVGVETGLHRHDAPMYAYVLEGELTVTYEDGTVNTYTPGTAMIEAVATAHNGKNNGSVPVKVLVVNIGAEGVSNTVKLP